MHNLIYSLPEPLFQLYVAIMPQKALQAQVHLGGCAGLYMYHRICNLEEFRVAQKAAEESQEPESAFEGDP